MPYILNTNLQTEEMLRELGLSSCEELFHHLPSQIKIKENLNLPRGLSEHSLREVMEDIGSKNSTIDEFNSFLGAGIYDHYIPSALEHIVSRCEFYTSYTPYQAECSQGVLQALYEYQTYICLLTGMDVTNASLYDGASALGEAVLMSLRLKNNRNKVLVSHSVHPEYRRVLATYMGGGDFSLQIVPFTSQGFIDLEFLENNLDENSSCFVLQSPNFLGLIEDLDKVRAILKDKGVLFILVTNPLSLPMLKEPYKLGVDIVCGDGQVLGGNLNLGGPTLGFLATKSEYLRQLPGRIVGRTIDILGNGCFCLTLQTREQHIKREKATSNICSNQSLNAIGAAIYLSLLGKDGLKKVWLYSFNLAHYLYNRLKELELVSLPFGERFFNEFVWHIEGANKFLNRLAKRKILAGLSIGNYYPQLKNCILSACTEKKKASDIDELIDNIKKLF
ncbi:MAG: aminomethyl-transferring glycine dehydrogenase subunit GcvPA [Candidatus Omnitrophica bacterium]|nr:aminomethyl-transferring glycine dehydrogenase subunit GcvPA [Candidatus Omnitrophota bacterium]